MRRQRTSPGIEQFAIGLQQLQVAIGKRRHAATPTHALQQRQQQIHALLERQGPAGVDPQRQPLFGQRPRAEAQIGAQRRSALARRQLHDRDDQVIGRDAVLLPDGACGIGFGAGPVARSRQQSLKRAGTNRCRQIEHRPGDIVLPPARQIGQLEDTPHQRGQDLGPPRCRNDVLSRGQALPFVAMLVGQGVRPGSAFAQYRRDRGRRRRSPRVVQQFVGMQRVA